MTSGHAQASLIGTRSSPSHPDSGEWVQFTTSFSRKPGLVTLVAGVEECSVPLSVWGIPHPMIPEGKEGQPSTKKLRRPDPSFPRNPCNQETVM